MKRIVLVATVLLFLCPFAAQADVSEAQSDLSSAQSSASDAELYARRAYSTFVLEEAQFNARKAEKAAVDTQKAIQSAISNLTDEEA